MYSVAEVSDLGALLAGIAFVQQGSDLAEVGYRGSASERPTTEDIQLIRPFSKSRINQLLLIVSILSFSWLGMQALHEAGHVCGAWVTGARVERVVLHPATISRTDVLDNTRPLVVVWAGPIVGVVLPIAVWLISAWVRSESAFLWRFFAGFCLIANGAYIAFGSLSEVGDCGEMLRNGSALWQLWLFGFITIPSGFWLWHGQGKYFGLGPNKIEVNQSISWIVGGLAVTILALEILVSG